MKIPNKRGLQQISTNHLSHVDFGVYKNLCGKFTAKLYSSSDIDTTLPSDKTLDFWKNVLEKV